MRFVSARFLYQVFPSRCRLWLIICALAVSYGSGSGQQSVTGYKDTSDAASLWTVKGAKVHSPTLLSAMMPCTAISER